MADRTQRLPADLAHALGDRVGHREQLGRLLVQQQVVVAEMRAADVPVEVLGLQVQREHVGQHRVQRRADVAGGLGRHVRGRGDRCALQLAGFLLRRIGQFLHGRDSFFCGWVKHGRSIGYSLARWCAAER
jgi:hypothetical protein